MPSSLKKSQEWFDSRQWKTQWPLHHAAMSGDVPQIHHLVIEKGFDPNQRMSSWFNSYPLGWAATFGQLRACVELVKLGADPFLFNQAGKNAVIDAKVKNFTAIVHFFEEYRKVIMLEKGALAITDIALKEQPQELTVSKA